jgi:hypothetical protein
MGKGGAKTPTVYILSLKTVIAVSTEQERIADGDPAGAQERPRLIFSTDLRGAPLLALLERPGVLATLSAQGYGIALALTELDDQAVQAVRLLNAHAIAAVAGLSLPPEDGFAFNLRNYPRALESYQAFHAWAVANELRFEAVGLSIEPPLEDVEPVGRPSRLWVPRALLRRLWLARENILYPPARTAYGELIVAIHHDGYDVHTYQIPVIEDDRRAGTTLIQRALDIVDLPSDLDVLMCSSSVPVELFGNDLGGALIASYGESADAIGIGSVGELGPIGGEDETTHGERAVLPWQAVRRDLLLADEQTDTIYVYSLEDCVERGLLPRIAALEWGTPARPALRQRALIGVLRGVGFAILVVARFGVQALAWGGWVVALVLWLRGRRRRRETGDGRWGPD